MRRERLAGLVKDKNMDHAPNCLVEKFLISHLKTY